MQQVSVQGGSLVIDIAYKVVELTTWTLNSAGISTPISKGFDLIHQVPATVGTLTGISAPAANVTPVHFNMVIDGMNGGMASDVHGGWFGEIGLSNFDWTAVGHVAGDGTVAVHPSVGPIAMDVASDAALTALLAR